MSRLVAGYGRFRRRYQSARLQSYRQRAAQQQRPQLMIISCSDSRITPAIVMRARLGEVFMVSNVANLVPPYQQGENHHYSTAAALEFAVLDLAVADIIILGHSQCGGIRALMAERLQPPPQGPSFIAPWVAIAEQAKRRVEARYATASDSEKRCHCEHQALLVSLHNLDSFPWLHAAQQEGRLRTHAWYFDIASGEIERYCRQRRCFVPLIESDGKI